jgi:hypothetical protein
MSCRTISFALLVALAVGAPRAGFAATADATQPVEKLFTAFNADSRAGLVAAYAPGAVVVDEFAPFVWHAPSAAAAFYDSFLALRKAAKLTKLHAIHGPLVFLAYDDAKTSAYVVAPTTITYRAADRPLMETGRWAFVLKKISGTWLIANSTWATTFAQR